MILTRYLTKEIASALVTVTLVLLLIFLSQQLVRYLSYAASGKIAANILLQLLGFEIPYLLSLLLPLGLYLGIILAYGRLYADNEMVVMQGAGLSTRRLISITSFFTLFITALIFGLMVWINPLIAQKKEQTLNEGMSVENILNSLMPGRFQVSRDGNRVIYVEKVARNRGRANNIFIADQVKTSQDDNAQNKWTVVAATQGYQIREPNAQRFFVAEDGNRYEGTPGQNNYKIIQFNKYAIIAPDLGEKSKRQDVEAFSTAKLWQQYSDPRSAAELQWRLSFPLAAIILSLLAIPLSHVQPRQGRYSQLLLAILIYVVYLNMLFMARNWVEQKVLSITPGMWLVHGLFLLFAGAVLLFRSTKFKIWIGRRS